MSIRLALGARPGQVRLGVQREILLTVSAGAALGIIAALLTTRTLQRFLVGVESTDLRTWLLALAVLGGAAWLASWLPARRATRLDPALVLRND
jgi:ABC-type antimicrobial peptide transport system permease subunit